MVAVASDGVDKMYVRILFDSAAFDACMLMAFKLFNLWKFGKEMILIEWN